MNGGIGSAEPEAGEERELSFGPMVGDGREVAVASVSIDLGAGRRGVDMGPSAIRIAGLTDMMATLGYRAREMGAVHASGPETSELGETRTRFLPEIIDVAERTRRLIRAALSQGALPLILGGDHSISIGTVSAVAGHHYRESGESIGLIWVDAHGDMNTPETTPSGNIHGMALACLMGRGPGQLTSMAGFIPAVPAEHVCILGVRDLDPGEKDLVRELGVRVFTMSEIDERGLAACVDEAVQRASTGTAGFHLSFDLDAIDPLVAPGVGTPVPGGITYREAHLICEKAARTGRMLSLEIVELNPVLDVQNRTARLAVGLVASALGKTIL